MAQKHQGRIRHLGFSCHGELDVLKRFLDAYGKDMEFCQLQLNYLDWTFQHGKEKVELLRQWGIPVWVMEPLRGGKLAKLQPEHEAALTAFRPDEEIPAWAFRFLQSIPSVTVILSPDPGKPGKISDGSVLHVPGRAPGSLRIPVPEENLKDHLIAFSAPLSTFF